MNSDNKNPKEQVVTLDIDSQGNVTQTLTDLEMKLESTLLNALYPGIKVAVVNVPIGPLDPYEESLVANAMANIHFKNIEFKLVGASGSSKDGMFYFVDARYSQAIAERFQLWPQAAVVYFGILVSTCKVLVQEPNATVLVVEDHVLGTNDCRGWIRQSLFQKLGLPEHHMYQFRLAFEKTQAKGCFKVMPDDVADLLEADIILPESSVKPGLKIPVAFYSLFGNGRKFSGPVVLGIREVSEEREFRSSYTLIEHAPDDSIQLEILPEAIRQARKLSESLAEGNYHQLLEILGLNDPDGQEDQELRTVEASLLADNSGYIVRFPYIHNQLNKLLASWAFEAATGGGFRLPAFALADDGYLMAYDGCVYSGSDWIPKDKAFAAVNSSRGLCVRYPIRMCDDLLPIEHLGPAELFVMLCDKLDEDGCAHSGAVGEQIATHQLWLSGTYVLHSETAKKNGGDFDGDYVGLLEGDRFPRFVEKRFNLPEEFHQEKNKRKKAKSPWWNLPQVAMKARGNHIGTITNLKTSCLAAGRPDLAKRLVAELQNALDNLKWDVEPNQEVIAEIRQQVTQAPWLRYKNAQRISELPIHLNVAETDRIGKLWNHVRKEIQDLLESKLPIAEFKGLVAGESVTRAMFDECRQVNGIYAAVVGKVTERQEKLKKQLDKTQAEWDRVRKDKDFGKAMRRETYQENQLAYAAHRKSEEQAKKAMKNIITWVRLWAAGKQEDRMCWLQALHTIVCNGRGSGGILFHAFPQEIIDRLSQRTGGKVVRVKLPELAEFSSRVDPEGRTFLVEQVQHGEKETFLFQYKDGQVFLEPITD
jgi:hypothetical protein